MSAVPDVQEASADRAGGVSAGCCPYYHEAIELIGRRWTGAILAVLLEAGRPLRFSEIAAGVPQVSDRLLSERLRELEGRGLVTRSVADGRVTYVVTEMGLELEPAIAALGAWARRWLS